MAEEARGAVSTYHGLGPRRGSNAAAREAGRERKKQGQKLDLLSTEATRVKQSCLS